MKIGVSYRALGSNIALDCIVVILIEIIFYKSFEMKVKAPFS